MKNIFKPAALVALTLAFSCGKDDVATNTMDAETEQLENTVLDVASVSDNVVINGGTKKQGSPPAPNGDVSLDVSNTEKTALLSEGFDVALNVGSDIVGAYIQFKSNDGTVADSYYDVNLETNTSGKSKKSTRKFIGNGSNSRIASKTEEVLLDVDFNSNVEPGTFCYLICVYNENGNISEPEEVCLTVESWGGKSDLISAWNLIEYTDNYEGEDVNTMVVGEEDCSNEMSLSCDEGGTYQGVFRCSTIGSFVIEFKEDGTFTYESNESGTELDSHSSSEACEAIYENYTDNIISNGKWAYVAEGDRLIMIEYSYSLTYNGEVESETYEEGEAEVLLDGAVSFNGDTMIMTQGDDDYEGTIRFQK